MPENDIRIEMVMSCQALDRSGLNRGASGNLSVRDGTDMLITPSAVAYDEIAPEMMARMPLVSDDDGYEGPKKPSSEWRFHRDILKARPDVNAVVHTHAPFCTILSIARKPIPAIHYMMAAFGGPDVRVADYARYGTAALSGHVIRAMEGRNGCLMAKADALAIRLPISYSTICPYSQVLSCKKSLGPHETCKTTLMINESLTTL